MPVPTATLVMRVTGWIATTRKRPAWPHTDTYTMPVLGLTATASGQKSDVRRACTPAWYAEIAWLPAHVASVPFQGK